MLRAKFMRAMKKDLPAIMERGGKPAEVYFCYDTGEVYFLEKDSFKKIDSDFEIKEGCGNFDSKVLDCCLLRAELERVYSGEE